ncbi:MAG: hypothetical protein JWO03_3081, partial [Bacteroidetes bacterium]|nr:hypothetical protein [Bacteroidota bacterium]
MKRIIALLTMYLTLSAGYAQNVGVGNTNPHTKLEVTGAISSTPVSSTAAGAVQVPDNVSVFMLTAVAGYQDNILTTVTPQEGQYLTIYNEDDDTASFSGYAISPLSGVASFTYIHSGWRMVSNNNIRTVADTGAYIKSQTSFDQPTGFRIGGNGFFNGGRIGMNISSPLYAVHINHNSFTDGLMLQNTSGGNTNIYMANYNDLIPGVSRPGASISAQNDGSYSASMVFATKQPGADANPLTERMRIRSNGNVGIGTNAPQQKLDVAGTAKMSGFQMPSPTAIKGYVMTTDTSGNGTWQGSELTQMASGIFDGSCIDSVGIATANGFGTFYVAASGSYAYVINYNSGSMNIFNISNRAAPTIVSTLPLSLSGISGIAVSGSYVYVISQFSNVLNTYNVSNPSAPTLVVSTPLTAGNNPAAIVVSGAYLYISCLGSGASLLIYNISNPTSPSLAGGYGVGGINFLAVSGAYAYGVSQGGRYMIIYNIINPSSPTQLSFTSLGSNAPVAVVASGSYVYVGLSNGTIATYNVSNPAAPVLAGSVFSGTNNGMAILGSYMAVTGTNNTLTLYNISNPASPVLVRSMPTGPAPRAVAFSGANILVTNFNNRTLEIFGPTC